MLLSEKHARLRAHDDLETVAVAHDFVVQHFGGDYNRASWFLNELAQRAGIDADRSAFYSIRHGRIKWRSLRANA